MQMGKIVGRCILCIVSGMANTHIVNFATEGEILNYSFSEGWPRVGLWTGTLKNPTKCLSHWEPDRRYNLQIFRPIP